MLRINTYSNSIISKFDSESIENRKRPKFVLFPEDRILTYWSILISFVLVYSVIFSPYELAFFDTEPFEFYVMDYIVDGIFFIDIILNCLTAYYDKDKLLVKSHKRIIGNYIKGWMIPDIIACLPIQIFTQSDKGYNGLIRIARVQRIYRFLRIAKLLRFIKLFKSTEQKNYINLVFKVSIELKRLIWFMSFFFIMIHFVTCIWVFVGKMNSDQPSNWIHNFHYTEYSNYDLYVAGFYWTVTTLVTVGYGDIYATNDSEKIYASIIMIIGIIIYSYTISSISNLVRSLDSRKQKLSNKLSLLETLCRDYKINPNFQRKIAVALQYEYKNHNKELDEILCDLPTSLKKQLLSLVFEKKLNQNAFFFDRIEGFLEWVAPRLKPLKIVPDEFVYKTNEFASEMYFILKGNASIMGLRGTEYFPVILLSEFYYFGEVDLLFSINKVHLNTVQSENGCELLTLSRDCFEELLNNFEDEAIKICLVAKERLERTNTKIKEATIEFESKFDIKGYRSIPKKDSINVTQIRETARSFNDESVPLRNYSLYSKIQEEKNPDSDLSVVKTKINSTSKGLKLITDLCMDIVLHLQKN